MASTIAIIGTGRVGSTAAYSLILQNIAAEILLVDINKKRCHGEKLDLSDALAFSRTSSITQACYKDLTKADIIVITAGFAQKDADETRDELAKKNIAIITDICKQFPQLKKNCCILLVTNPVDIITRAVTELLSDHPINQIFGSGTWLDTQRVRRIIGRELFVAPESVDAFVIGEHGDHQVTLWQNTLIGGIPITNWGITKKQKEAIEEETRNSAYEIIEKKDATFFGIASCIADICSAIIFNQKKILPLSWNPNRGNVVQSVPVIIGTGGIEKQCTLTLSEIESKALIASMKHLENIWQKIWKEKGRRLLPE